MTTRHKSLWDDLAYYPKDMGQFANNWHLPTGIRSNPTSFPAINLEVSTEAYDYYVFVAGLDKDCLQISADKHLLTITGEKPVMVPDEADVVIHRIERTTGKFTRTVNLPTDINIDNIDANYRNGVLHIKALRSGQSDPTTIEIK